jgi:hypothetical protein
MAIAPINNGESGSSVRASLNSLITDSTARGTLLSEVGVDCSGATFAHVALQAAYDAAPDESNLIIPRGSLIKLGAQTTLTDRVGVRLISDGRPKNYGPSPQIIWAASGGTAFAVNTCDHPGFEGIFFNGATGSGCPDSWIVFDGEGGVKNATQAKVSHCSFMMDAGHTGYKAIQISPTANVNHENYEISDCEFTGYQDASSTVMRATDGVTTNSSTALSSATATFVTGDVGKRIIISCALGALETTIASRTNGTDIVLTAPWTLASQTGATIHIGQMYGTAIYQRGNNSFATRFTNIGISYFSIGLDLGAGSNGFIHSIGGGFNDTCISMNGGWDLDRYDCEDDVRAILLPDGVTRPNHISAMRMVTEHARADGWFSFASSANIKIEGSVLDQTPAATNAMLFSNYGGGAKVLSENNIYGGGGGGYSRSGSFGTLLTDIVGWTSIADQFAEGWNSVQTIFNNLPTSDPVLSGAIWSDGRAFLLSGSDALGGVGYLGVPQRSATAGDTAILADAGKHILMTTAGTYTIPANASVAYPVGTVLTFINNTTTCTIPITSDTMTLAGTATTGTRTLAANGIATAIKKGTTNWLISGPGLT